MIPPSPPASALLALSTHNMTTPMQLILPWPTLLQHLQSIQLLQPIKLHLQVCKSSQHLFTRAVRHSVRSSSSGASDLISMCLSTESSPSNSSLLPTSLNTLLTSFQRRDRLANFLTSNLNLLESPVTSPMIQHQSRKLSICTTASMPQA